MASDRTLHVRLFGGLDLRLGGRRLAPLESGRAESLLAFLLLHRHAAQPRQRIAFLLWPDSSEAQARTNLRHVLHNLRRALPEADRFLEAGPRTLRWRDDAPVRLDVDEFERALAAGRLEEAAELYGGDLLAGSYDDWLLEERERLRDRHLDALARLAERAAADGDHAAAVRFAERLVRSDPLREESHRLLIAGHAARGDTASAVRAYHVCAATLRRDLDIEPSATTRSLYETLLPQAPGAPAPAGHALVARDAELRRLLAAWTEAERGRPRMLLVTGERGVGKTRLADEARRLAAGRGAITAEARAYEAEGAIAYGPVAAWLRAPALAPHVRRLDAPRLGELARLLPELQAERGARPAEPLDAAEQRRRLFDALGKALVPGAPVLLVADDLHWADVETARLLHFLLRGQPGTRLLVLATLTREDLPPGHPVEALVRGLESIGRLEELALARLGRDGTRLLAEELSGRALGEEEADRLHAESEGSPLFVVEAMRAGRGAAGPGARVETVIAARLARLSAGAREVAGVAAALGREFGADVLAESVALGESELAAALDELWRRGIIRAHGPAAYDFGHGRIREAAYAALAPETRRRVHLRAARALEALHGADADAVAARVAVQYEGAGAFEEAERWQLRAARFALGLGAAADAVAALERALAHNARLPPSTRRDERELAILSSLPSPLVAVEGYLSERGARTHARAQSLVRRLGADPEPPLVFSLAMAALARGDFPAALPRGEQLRERAERDGDEVTWVQSAYILGIAAYWLGRLSEARGHLESALARHRPEHLGDQLRRYGHDPQAVVSARLAHTLWLLGEEEAALRARDAALAACEHPYSHAAAVVWACLLAIDREDADGLRAALPEIAEVAEPRQISVMAEALAGVRDAFDGEGAGGVARAERALAQVRDDPPAPGSPGTFARVVLAACVAAGDAAATVAAAGRLVGAGQGAEVWISEALRRRARARLALGGAPAEARADLERAVAAARAREARAQARLAQADLEALARGTLAERTASQDPLMTTPHEGGP